MKIVKSSFEVLDLELEREPLKKIEYCGRTCYQSIDKIGEDTYKKFISTIIKNGHYSVMEHGNIIIEMEQRAFNEFLMVVNPVKDLKFFKVSSINSNIISGNFRSWIELIKKYETFKNIKTLKNLLSFSYPECFEKSLLTKEVFDFEILSVNDLTSDEFKTHARITVKFIADRAFLAEIRTHRDASFSAESTRYANYSNGKFNGEIAVIEPFFFIGESAYSINEAYELWIKACAQAEISYMRMVKDLGVTPQQARTVLPQSLKSEVIVTANFDEWEHIFELRTEQKAHPQMRELMVPLQKKFKELFG